VAGESEEDLRGAYGGYKDEYEEEHDAASSGEHGRRVLKVRLLYVFMWRADLNYFFFWGGGMG